MAACGPMNSKPPATAGAAGALQEEDPSFSDRIGFSQKHLFVVVTRLLNGDAEHPGKAKVGENHFELRFFNNSGMTSVSKNFVLTGEYGRERATGVSKTYPVTFERQADGSFSGTITFKRSGDYELTLHFGETKTEDSHVVRLSI